MEKLLTLVVVSAVFPLLLDLGIARLKRLLQAVREVGKTVLRRLIGVLYEPAERIVHPHTENKPGLDETALLILSDTLLDLLVMENDLLLACKLLDSQHDPCRMRKVHQEHAVEESDEERKRQIVRQPLKGAQDVRMDDEVIHRTEDRPQKRIKRADDALDISPAVRVVPQAEFKVLQTEESRDILDDRHTDHHQEEKKELFEHRMTEIDIFFDRGDQVKQYKAEAVDRKIRARKESRVDPFFL